MGLTPLPEIASYFELWFSTIDLTTLADGSNIPQINHKDIRRLQVPLPPSPERESIVDEVNRRLTVIAKVEAIVDANLVRVKALRQSILQKAFSGQL